MKSKSGEVSHQEARAARLMRLATLASVLTACLLIAVKLFAYISTGAVSILASLMDSLMDSAASLINFFAVRYALSPADKNHRFGHGKAESLAALIQAALIVATSAFLIHEAMHRFFDPVPMPAVTAGVAVMLLAMVVTSLLVMFQVYVVRRTGSTAIHADSIHYRADLLSNAATLLALLLASQGVIQADPVFALLIALYLLVSTREILRQAVNELLDRELPEHQQQQISAIALANASVKGLHDLRTRQSGRTAIIQLHLEMDSDISLLEAHRISDEVEVAILEHFPGADIVIHQDPADVIEVQHWQTDDPLTINPKET
ncbi:cation diffusion facilitator family transporter [Congregibacter brevis]|uniref:Cation diffusion facilitator family transporter n=1 Tax=Congregibacter brevis TaxID=3081201 RepID=A0ABZ0IG09_9GAMM|nr:cation diffusion facilitator family transporter [Congregibacter sp. IMCC45268]